MKIAYCAMIEPQNGGGFTVTFPDLPDAITEGDTEEEALYNAAEVLTLTLDGRLAEGEEIPEPVYLEGVVVYPYPLCQAAVLGAQIPHGSSPVRYRAGAANLVVCGATP